MPITEDQAAKILLIRSIEEGDKTAFSERILADALAAAKDEKPGLNWIEKRASYLFEHLSPWHQSILQLAKAPAHWTLPVCFLALILGLATNLLGPSDKIHVIRNPVFFLVAWNILVYVALLLMVVLRKRTQIDSGLHRRFSPSARPAPVAEPSHRRSAETAKIPWAARYMMPRIWQFVHKVMFGFHETRNLANLTSRFTMHWFSLAGSLVVARWRYLFHLAALCLATGAAVGMYFRGLFQGYEFVWASTFMTDEKTVSAFIKTVFGPGLFISRLLNLGLSERVDVARLMTQQGDTSDAWIHLFAITVVVAVVIPRGLLALFQSRNIAKRASGFGLVLDHYYGEVIETPIRAIIEKEAETAVTVFAENVASYVGSTLYVERIVPKLQRFRETGGRIADLKSELIRLTEAFSPQLKTYIVDSAIPGFQRSLSQRVGEILKNVGADFIDKRDPEAVLGDLSIDAAESAELGVSSQFSRAIGVSVGTAISLTFAAVAGGLGEELGIAIIATILGTTGPVGFVIGLIVGGLVAVGAWWFGKEKIAETIDQVNLPAVVVRTALWESRFKRLIEDGQKKCEESVREKVKERLEPVLPRVTEEILFRIRSLWR